MVERTGSPLAGLNATGWDAAFEGFPLGMAVVAGSTIVRANVALCELLGVAREDLIGRNGVEVVAHFMGPDVLGDAAAGIFGARAPRPALAGPAVSRFHLEGTLTRDDGSERWVATEAVVVDEAEVVVLATVTDLTDLHHARRRLSTAERLASSQAAVLELIARGEPLEVVAEACVHLVEANGMGGLSSVYVLDGLRLELLAGRAPAAVSAWVHEPIRGRERSVCDSAILDATASVVGDLDQPVVAPGLRRLAASVDVRAAWSQPIMSITTGLPVGTLSTLYRTRHEPSDHERQVAEVACSLVAIALERSEAEARLAHQATHDPLTGLPNRTLLLDRLERALARRSPGGVAVLFCDIDRFKVVNDSLGHGVGDEVLLGFARRFRSAVAPEHTVARFGGDEFVVLLEDLEDDEQPSRVAGDLARALDPPFVLPGGQEVYLTASIGITQADHDRSGDSWLRDADAAMYRAKADGRNRHVRFDAEMRRAALDRLQVETDLRRAVIQGELIVHYQAVVDLPSGRIVGAEALVRWQHPERGLLRPADFMPIAEDAGLARAVDHHVLDAALAAMRPVLARNPGFRLGVNASGRQIGAPGLADLVEQTCAAHDWPHHALVLEITESAILEGAEESVEQLQRLHDLGVELAIDDFGTGASSLTRLSLVPVAELKIDQSFVATIDQPGNRTVGIVDAVTAMTRALGLRATAEGVESGAQLEHLRRIGCDHAQGYYFSKPLPLEEFLPLIESDPRW